MKLNIENSWQTLLEGELKSEYFAKLSAFVDEKYAKTEVYPPQCQIFEAFNRTPLEKVKVVILGQDPYHNPGQAHGLCFSVPHGVKHPPSLKNIYKELEAEYGQPFRGRDGDLSHWADQGVLLLNATLTVDGGANSAGSHQNRGWERFTDAAIRLLSEKREHLVFMLWGSYAQRKAAFVNRDNNLVLECAHPSPLSARRGFFGCGHFKKCNEYLCANNLQPISW